MDFGKSSKKKASKSKKSKKEGARRKSRVPKPAHSLNSDKAIRTFAKQQGISRINKETVAMVKKDASTDNKAARRTLESAVVVAKTSGKKTVSPSHYRAGKEILEHCH